MIQSTLFCQKLGKMSQNLSSAEVVCTLRVNILKFFRTYGDNKHCRRVLQRALNSVNDWPESIIDAYINFEREEGRFTCAS